MSTNETKWTPGPWKIRRSGCISAGDEGALVATTGYRVEAGKNEDDANARLIAAAPEMYEALQAEKYAQALANDPNSQEQAKVARARADDFRRAALAKAEGREP